MNLTLDRSGNSMMESDFKVAFKTTGLIGPMLI